MKLKGKNSIIQKNKKQKKITTKRKRIKFGIKNKWDEKLEFWIKWKNWKEKLNSQKKLKIKIKIKNKNQIYIYLLLI